MTQQSVKLFNNSTTLTEDANHYWKMDDNSDDSIGSINGSDTNVTYGTAYGKIEEGASFNGSSSKIVLASNSTAIFTNSSTDRTYSVWVYPTSSAISGSIFRSTREGESGLSNVAMGGTSTYLYYLLKMNTGYQTIYSTLKSINNWYHLVVTLDLTNRFIYMYINGVVDMSPGYGGALTGTTISTYSGFGYTTVGVNFFGSAEFFSGYIDEVGLWNRVLTASEIKELYWAGYGKTYPFI